jgi:hypothetical protein
MNYEVFKIFLNINEYAISLNLDETWISGDDDLYVQLKMYSVSILCFQNIVLGLTT